MTYRELFYKATRLIDKGEITLGEYDEMTKPLNREIEQQPCDDAISREAVIEWLKAKDIIKLSSQEETARKELKALSPVTPQKYGKWIDYSDEGFVECPFCGHATNCEDNINELHYCFYCGACMKDGRTLDEFIEDSKESEEA